ncbi:hypothetical protein GCM10025867_46440 (plasmid) [Frondihabitans sucicola]|uniref:Uncharacterized protein n=1 Tax=Frondihabitans sucicola TaxID=1268041 RepID=A0ABN6YA54_9MICO|nr:hypothetical protein [Frondihabitans sucicola]BDZ52403.1 hypothetical protein GCM10025867_46440 [Frondihabitans sucicola]
MCFVGVSHLSATAPDVTARTLSTTAVQGYMRDVSVFAIGGLLASALALGLMIAAVHVAMTNDAEKEPA